jgi:hypothetical protein
LEFTPDELLTATRAAALQQELPARSIESPTSSSPRAPPAVRARFRAPDAARDLNGISVQIAAALALTVAELGMAWELSSVSHRPIPTTAVTAELHVPAVKPSPLLPAPAERLPVRFTNPFDASEVFEFPPETSVTQAHDAVADLLLQRARDRRQWLAKMKGGLRADRHPPRSVTAQISPRPLG